MTTLLVTCALTLLAGCAVQVSGRAASTVANARLPVRGDSGDAFDTDVKNALSDVMGFWAKAYPSISGGKSLPPLKGKLYSIDGEQLLKTRRLPASVAGDACLRKDKLFVVDNAAYCELDDSIVWDRSPGHLVPLLASRYGTAVVALVFAHEFGHAIQHRLGIDKRHLPTIDLESQADCAAGAFLATALAGTAPHFHLTALALDRALEGFLQIRDSTPDSPEDISHGNGFDRISAIGDGIAHGVTYCYSGSYFDRTFTERPFVGDDYATGGNEPLADVIDGKGGLLSDLDRFWTAAGNTVGKAFRSVTLVKADHPACGAYDASAEIGYCPDDNTVYLDPAFAKRAYYSLTARVVDRTTGDITLRGGQPADFALGELISIAWGMAAGHQFFGRSVDDRAGLLAAICYSGSYAKDVNRASEDATHDFLLSPPDMDEATSAVLDLVGLQTGYGARGTSGLDRVQAFVKGYVKGLSAC